MAIPLISLNHSAFIKGMSISDNIMLAQEIVCGYSRSTLSPICALKVDFKKDFDSLSWDFIAKLFKVLKFPRMFIDWVMCCVFRAWFSVFVNGGLAGYFKGEKGVRQGDPLSPYIFVLAMNALSSLLNLAVKYDVFKYHPRCRRIGLTHLSFADDLLVFVKGDLVSVKYLGTFLLYFWYGS